MRQNKNKWPWFLIIAFLFLSISCTASLRNKELEKVARDWSLVIRASQVIPVYPLTEDLQPGDVLLVRTPIEEQVRLYQEKGFLPLDQLFVRLYTKDAPDNYKSVFYNFYNSRYGITDEIIMPPAQWQAMNGDKHNWDLAPRAAFPAYQFEVRTGSGLNLAIPIQGVPFALGLMNSGRAKGTITIADAYTYGIDNFSLEKQMNEWGRKNRKLLREYEPIKDGEYHFLRVISRIYVTGSVDVTLNNDDSTGAETAAGADRPVHLMGIKDSGTSVNYNDAISSINNLLREQAPGIKARIATASSRSVTLTQDFARPLVIGYVGFDMPILKGGRLGAPISTLGQLNKTDRFEPSRINDTAYIYRLASLSHMNNAFQEIMKSGNEDARRIAENLDKLSLLLPDNYPFTVYHQPLPNSIEPLQNIGFPVDKKLGFNTVIDYLGYADTSRYSLAKYLVSGSLSAEEKKKYEEELHNVRTAIMEMEDRLNQEPILMDAIDFVFFGK